METIKEKVAYLKGMSDGLGINHETKEGKLLLAIIDVIDDMAEEIDLLNEAQTELDDYVDAIDEDLARIEEDIYEDDDENDYEDDGYIEMECPNCHETVYLDEAMFEDEEEDEILCPNCNEPLPFACECGCDCGCDDEECDCDCDCE